jgi:hypothetical protein
MVHLDDLVNAMTTTLLNIPELVADLAPAEPIVGYIDSNPTSNSVDKAIYQMQPGQVMVIWRGTALSEGEMSKWDHRMEICVRSLPGHSDLTLIDEIMQGVPNPGDGLIWRFCPIMAGLLPTKVTDISRATDSEGVDYGVILTSTLETGDYPNP